MASTKSRFKVFIHSLLRAEEETVRLRRDFCRLLSGLRSASLLDVGAGDGEMTLEYARLMGVPEGGAHAIEAKDDYLGRIPGTIKSVKLDIETARFPYPDSSFEAVTCNQVLEHLKNIFLPLSEMERVLKPGGFLALGIPNLAGLHNRVLLALGLQPACNDITGPHIRCFAHKAFLRFLASNPNFRLVSFSGSSLYPLPYPAVDYGARFLPGLSAYTFYLLQKETSPESGSAWMRGSIGDTCI